MISAQALASALLAAICFAVGVLVLLVLVRWLALGFRRYRQHRRIMRWAKAYARFNGEPWPAINHNALNRRQRRAARAQWQRPSAPQRGAK